MSVYARSLAGSGFLGIATVFAARLASELLRDPIVYGVRVPPDWVDPVTTALFVGSVAVVLYALVLDDAFSGWADLVSIGAVTSQWGFPLGVYLTSEPVASPYVQLFLEATALLHVLVALAVAVNAARPE